MVRGMKPIILPMLMAVCALSACLQTPEPALDERALIQSALQGEYIGTASTDAGASFDAEGILHSFEPIAAPQFGDYVLYYQIIVDGGDSPASQRKIFVLEQGEGEAPTRMSAYILSPEQTFNPASAETIAALDPNELMSFPEVCDFTWSATEQGFEGVVERDACAFEGRVFKGTVRADMTFNISGDTLLWQEALYTGDFVPIVSTDGLQRAVRQPSQ